ncbi:hypothetical protein [Ramlibacter albus]|uniref:Copper resistance protein NlpE n=1 Tax=Ramlibacter albus TaxID=2079448 RepID=A0A923S3Y5_9BURK|nr:hypothetical protein [Ramlibacter albus]MBC5763567.1 hypothetical protein [Ramlibacter albus]
MQAKKFLTALSAAIALAAPAWSQTHSDPEKKAAGTWYGEYQPAPRQALQRFVTTRAADGTFTLHARMYENGKVVAELKNRGLWGVSNGMYFTVTTEVNDLPTEARKPDVINAYLVQKLEGDEFEYMHVASGNRFRVKRVEAGSVRLPD